MRDTHTDDGIRMIDIALSVAAVELLIGPFFITKEDRRYYNSFFF